MTIVRCHEWRGDTGYGKSLTCIECGQSVPDAKSFHLADKCKPRAVLNGHLWDPRPEPKGRNTQEEMLQSKALADSVAECCRRLEVGDRIEDYDFIDECEMVAADVLVTNTDSASHRISLVRAAGLLIAEIERMDRNKPSCQV